MDHIYGIKTAPFNRYFTLDVLRAMAESGKDEEITLYTGNDDSIIYDLITPPSELLLGSAQITDANPAFFDGAHH